MLKIWGRKNSVNVQKVLWCCAELDLPFERIEAGSESGDLDNAKYRALNPNGLVPSIDDEGLVLWESNTIVRYLGAKHDNGKLWPQQPAARALSERWMDWQLSAQWAVMRPLFIQLIRNSPQQRDQAIIDNAYRDSLAACRLLNDHLASHAYVGGENFTLGDIPAGAVTHRWMTLPIERPDLPHLAAWYARLCEREGYQQHVKMPLS